MKKIMVINFLTILLLLCHEGKGQIKSPMSAFKIRHSVVFSLKHPKGSEQERVFLEAARKLATIKGVNRFECLREVSTKNNFDYGLSMEFESQQAYEDYQKDPAHEAFVNTFWTQHVKDFLEIDLEEF